MLQWKWIDVMNSLRFLLLSFRSNKWLFCKIRFCYLCHVKLNSWIIVSFLINIYILYVQIICTSSFGIFLPRYLKVRTSIMNHTECKFYFWNFCVSNNKIWEWSPWVFCHTLSSKKSHMAKLSKSDATVKRIQVWLGSIPGFFRNSTWIEIFKNWLAESVEN